MNKTLFYILFWFLSCTWGIIMTLIGAIAALVLMCCGYRPSLFGPYVYFTVGRGWGGVNFGPFFVIAEDMGTYTETHEAGHGLQNIIWGPLFPFVIAIPSFIRYWYREIIYRTNPTRYYKLPPYNSIWFERQATLWGYELYSKSIIKKEG